jgi:hypothetical protein
MSDSSRSFVQRTRASIVAVAVIAGCGGCAAPETTADADSYSPRFYRTGSTIPVKDYGAANIDVAPPDIVNPVNRPLNGAPLLNRPGG